MEAKLREYRALRRRKEIVENVKAKVEKTKQRMTKLFMPKIFSDMANKKEDEVLLVEHEDTSKEIPPMQELEELVEYEETPIECQESWRYFTIKWTIYFMIWLTCYLFFLKVGFGAVFFVISCLVGICLNTRTRRRKQGEVSAYSVFNEDCTSIDGTLKAEDLQKQMLYGMAGIHNI